MRGSVAQRDSAPARPRNLGARSIYRQGIDTEGDHRHRARQAHRRRRDLRSLTDFETRQLHRVPAAPVRRRSPLEVAPRSASAAGWLAVLAPRDAGRGDVGDGEDRGLDGARVLNLSRGLIAMLDERFTRRIPARVASDLADDGARLDGGEED